jgi:hypothetical protein
MLEKKAAIVASLVALTLLGAPLAASASPSFSGKVISGVSIHTEDQDDEDEDEDEDEEDEDEDEDEDDRHNSIPPVFVVPGHKKPHQDRNHATGGALGSGTMIEIDPLTNKPVAASIEGIAGTDFVVVGAGNDPATESIGGVNPVESRAVDIKRVTVGMRSPADQFMDSAYLGMGTLGVAALGLGVTAGVRAIRIRRSGKSDYFYGDK